MNEGRAQPSPPPHQHFALDGAGKPPSYQSAPQEDRFILAPLLIRQSRGNKKGADGEILKYEAP